MSGKDKRSIYFIYGLLIMMWELSCIIFNIKEYIIPRPSNILLRLFSSIDDIYIDILYTLSEAIIGVIFGVIIAIIIAIIFNEKKIIKDIFMPILNMIQMIPVVAIAPLFAIWFGFGLFPKVLLIALISSFPIIMNLNMAIENKDLELFNYLTTLNISKFNMYKYYYSYISLESLYTALNISLTYSIITALFSEYMGSRHGLGLLLNKATSSSDTEMVFVIIIIIIILSLFLLKLNKIIFKGVIYEN